MKIFANLETKPKFRCDKMFNMNRHLLWMLFIYIIPAIPIHAKKIIFQGFLYNSIQPNLFLLRNPWRDVSPKIASSSSPTFPGAGIHQSKHIGDAGIKTLEKRQVFRHDDLRQCSTRGVKIQLDWSLVRVNGPGDLTIAATRHGRVCEIVLGVLD